MDSRRQTMRVGDIDVAYRIAGRGASVVLIHGLAEDHRTWSIQQDELDTYQTLAYDIRGHGKTTLGAAAGTLEQLGQDLVGLLDQLGPATCVGFSLGGTVVQWAAAERSDLVRSAVLIGTSSIVGRKRAAFYRSRIELFSTGDRDRMAKALLEDTSGGIVIPGVDVARVVKARLEAVGDGRGYCNGAAAMAGIHEMPLTNRILQIRCPVLVVSGAKDPFCPPEAAHIMLESISHAEYAEVPDVGHFMNSVEAPHAVADLIQSFADRHAA